MRLMTMYGAMHFLQDELWGLTCSMPLKSAAIVIFKFHKVM